MKKNKCYIILFIIQLTMENGLTYFQVIGALDCIRSEYQDEFKTLNQKRENE